MKYLSEKGLSMSQAQSISNICNQYSEEIENLINSINNYSTVVVINEKEFNQIVGKRMPENIIELITELGIYRELQAYLMEAVKYKHYVIENLESDKTRFENIYRTNNPMPIKEEIEHPKLKPFLKEEDIWKTLSEKEMVEYLSTEAKASVIGKFIHKKGKLSQLRNELPSINQLGWTTDPSGDNYPTMNLIHHTADDLFKVYETLSVLHRQYESRVNYYKSKVKNILYEKNNEIISFNQKVNSDHKILMNEVDNDYTKKLNDYNSEVREKSLAFVKATDEEINRISKLRIIVPSEHKDLIDKLLQFTSVE